MNGPADRNDGYAQEDYGRKIGSRTSVERLIWAHGAKILTARRELDFQYPCDLCDRVPSASRRWRYWRLDPPVTKDLGAGVARKQAAENFDHLLPHLKFGFEETRSGVPNRSLA